MKKIKPRVIVYALIILLCVGAAVGGCIGIYSYHKEQKRIAERQEREWQRLEQELADQEIAANLIEELRSRVSDVERYRKAFKRQEDRCEDYNERKTCGYAIHQCELWEINYNYAIKFYANGEYKSAVGNANAAFEGLQKIINYYNEIF